MQDILSDLVQNVLQNPYKHRPRILRCCSAILLTALLSVGLREEVST
jgi:hypothetical protein